MPLNPDDTLLNGQYRILRLLGRGGFGFVYQARDTLIHRDVAIKELIPAHIGSEATLKRFLVEARATMELAHESIVRTYNVFQESGNYYIVMECMAGGSLEERLRERGALPVDEAVRITAEVCSGLEHAHRRGIVHCDLKPANILFTSSGNAKVADFGIAHVSGEMLTRSWNTPAGFAAGTLPYMSPEQTDGLRDDPRVDVYAMGAVLYRMLTGRTYLDFDQRETPGAQADNVLRIRNAEPVPPRAYSRRIPAWLDGVVLKALSKEPERRYGSAAEMGAALERRGAASPIPPPVKAEPAPAPARPRAAHRPAWFWPAVGAAGVLLIALVVALALLFGGGTPPTNTPAPEPTQVIVVESTATKTPSPTVTMTATPMRTRPVPTSTWTTSPTLSPTNTATPTETPKPSVSAVPSRTTLASPTLTKKPTIVPTRALPSFTSVRITWVDQSADDSYQGYACLNALDAEGQPVASVCCTPKVRLWCSITGHLASPDSRKIAYEVKENYTTAENQSGYVAVFVPTGQSWIPIGPIVGPLDISMSLAWNPTSTRLAYQSQHDGNCELYVADLQTRQVVRITDSPGTDDRPNWVSAVRLRYCQERDGQYETYEVDWDGADRHKIGDGCTEER